MGDFTRQRDWFDPERTHAAVTVVGCGGIGSFTAFALAKLGVRDLHLVDFDTVETHNTPNQLFTPNQIGTSKVAALAETITHATDTEVTVHANPLQDGIPLAPVVVSALDSMQARAELWTQIRNRLAVRLFVDGRLGGQNVVLYSVKPTNPQHVRGYEATLHTDADGDDLPCTARSVIDVGFAIGSLITRAVRCEYADETPTPMVYLNQRTLEIHTSDWVTDNE
jgi:ThiF family